jgi:Predicted AAA-ATPase/PD-(D/E)XK nuclease superfamily
MKQLPIGEQNFAKIRSLDMLYVDKTKQIHDLLKGGRYNLLTKPRRFGKSLTLSTIQHIFEGRKELFRGLWIEDQWDWSQKHPVIHLSFNVLNYRDNKLEEALCKFLDKQAQRFGIHLNEISAKEKLSELILSVNDLGDSVVLLIDEYDKPLIDYLDKTELEQAKTNRGILKNFYGSLKSGEVQLALRFFLITGVSKFSQVSLFSDLNYLRDISFNPKFNTLVGYTQQELNAYFEEYLVALQEQFPHYNREALLEKIKVRYNGYSWNGKERVYNPFSVLLLFDNLQFGDFWFQTGTPGFLIQVLREQEVYKVDEIQVPEVLFNSYDLENLDARVLMFQTGYLTVKHLDAEHRRFTLAYPNQEVEEALNNYLIGSLLNRLPADSLRPVVLLEEGFKNNDLPKVITVINSLLKDIPSNLLDDKTEHFYHALVHLHFRYLGFTMDSEVHTSDGRMDAVVKTANHVYIIEFKMNVPAQVALDQIRDKQYAEKYRLSNKTILGLGISFDTEKKAVKDWVIEAV